MADRGTVKILAQLAELRKAQKLAAEALLRAAISEEDAALRLRDHQAAQRDRAESEWSRLLSSNRPNPALFKMGGAWLVEQQELLKSEELNVAIAQSLTEKARSEHSGSLAREAAINKVAEQARKTMVKHLIELQETQVVDQLIWGASR